MTIDDIRAAKYAEPFQPFTVCIVDGRRWPVAGPMHVALSPTGESIVVGLPDGSFDRVFVEAIDNLLVGQTEFVDHITGNGS